VVISTAVGVPAVLQFSISLWSRAGHFVVWIFTIGPSSKEGTKNIGIYYLTIDYIIRSTTVIVFIVYL
jgi:hypothetical protein